MQQTHSTFHTISGECHQEMDCQSWSTAPALRYQGIQCNPAWLNPFTRPKSATTLACWFLQHKFWSWHSALLMWVLWICSHFWRERCHYGRDSCSWTASGMRSVETCLPKYEGFQIWGANLGLWTICTQVLFLPFWLIQEFSRCTYHIHDMDDIHHLILTTVLKWQDLSDHKSRMCNQESSCNNSFVMGNQIWYIFMSMEMIILSSLHLHDRDQLPNSRLFRYSWVWWWWDSKFFHVSMINCQQWIPFSSFHWCKPSLHLIVEKCEWKRGLFMIPFDVNHPCACGKIKFERKSFSRDLVEHKTLVRSSKIIFTRLTIWTNMMTVHNYFLEVLMPKKLHGSLSYLTRRFQLSKYYK
jgi:hypothetical protein